MHYTFHGKALVPQRKRHAWHWWRLVSACWTACAGHFGLLRFHSGHCPPHQVQSSDGLHTPISSSFKQGHSGRGWHETSPRSLHWRGHTEATQVKAFRDTESKFVREESGSSSWWGHAARKGVKTLLTIKKIRKKIKTPHLLKMSIPGKESESEDSLRNSNETN